MVTFPCRENVGSIYMYIVNNYLRCDICVTVYIYLVNGKLNLYNGDYFELNIAFNYL